MTSPWPAKISQDAAVAGLTRTISAGAVWVCRTEGIVVGYAVFGQPTPPTIAIQNVYVAPSHRRKGIAEALVRTTTRYYLGLTLSGAQNVPEIPPSGVKEEVNLLMTDPGAEGVYRRAGFLFPSPGDSDVGGRDPATGRKASSNVFGGEFSQRP